jgi:hypothetical protein
MIETDLKLPGHDKQNSALTVNEIISAQIAQKMISNLLKRFGNES